MKKLLLIFLLIFSTISFASENNEDSFTIKLKEIFGEKITIYLYPYTSIQGKIFIFDQIKKKEDLEEYQNKVIEVISYLKEKNQFDLSYISFFIVDERVLWANSINGVRDNLKSAKYDFKKIEDFLDYREKALSSLESEITEEKIVEKIKKLDPDFIEFYYNNDFINYSMLYHTTIYGPKAWRDSSDLSYYKKANFDKKENIIFYDTMEVLFEYEEKDVYYKNEWGRVPYEDK